MYRESQRGLLLFGIFQPIIPWALEVFSLSANSILDCLPVPSTLLLCPLPTFPQSSDQVSLFSPLTGLDFVFLQRQMGGGLILLQLLPTAMDIAPPIPWARDPYQKGGMEWREAFTHERRILQSPVQFAVPGRWCVCAISKG